MNENIFLEIRNIITKRTEYKDIDLFTRIDRYPFDDLDRVMIEMGIEDYFHIDLIKHDKELKEVETIYDLVKLVEKIIWFSLELCYIIYRKQLLNLNVLESAIKEKLNGKHK